MKRSVLLLALLIIGITLIVISLVSAAVKTANSDIIGGADLPTYIFVVSHGNGGVYTLLILLGLVTVIGAIVALAIKKKKQ